MCGDNLPSPESAVGQPGARTGLHDLVSVELDRLEEAAAAAQPISSRHRGWVSLPSDSGLSEAEEDFIDYWSPQRVLDDCRAKRRLLAWIEAQGRSEDLTAVQEDQLVGLLLALVTGQSD
jgi:hypothetical protein